MPNTPTQSLNGRDYSLDRQGALYIQESKTQTAISLTPEETKFLKIYLNIYTE